MKLLAQATCARNEFVRHRNFVQVDGGLIKAFRRLYEQLLIVKFSQYYAVATL